MWRGGFISFLPPRDNNGHCLCAQSGLATFPTLCHSILLPSRRREESRCVLSAVRLLPVEGTRAAGPGGCVSSGAGYPSSSSWTP